MSTSQQNRTTTAMLVACLAAIVPSGMSHAHVGDLIDTRDVIVTPEGPAIEGTFGLIPTTADGSLAWVCHEAVTAPGALTSPDYARSPDGTWASRMPDLVQARDGHPVWVSADLCDWTPATGLDGRVIAQVTFGPDGTMWVATADESGPNVVLAGPDADSLVPVLTADARFLSVAVGAAVWVTSSSGDTALTVWHSPDGTAFTPHTLPVPPGLTVPVDVRVEVAHPDDPSLAWAVLDPIGEDHLLALGAGGASVETLWEAPERITDLARSDAGALYAILGDRRPWRVRAGPTEPVDPVDLTGLADASGLAATSTLFLSDRSFVNGLLLTESADGETPSLTRPPSDIAGPLACPEGTTQATVCAPLWDTLAPRLQPVVDTGDTGAPADTDPPPDLEPPDERGCGCQPSGGPTRSGPLALLLIAAVAARRSRVHPPR